jgi:hypothetical protein
MVRSPFVGVFLVLIALAILLALPADASAEAWTFTYSYRGKTVTYPTRYATRQEARSAFNVWRKDRYQGVKNPPTFVRVNHLPKARPDSNRKPY